MYVFYKIKITNLRIKNQIMCLLEGFSDAHIFLNDTQKYGFKVYGIFYR